MYEDDNSQGPAYRAKLLQWQKVYEQALHSDRAAVDIGLFTMKVVMVINGGALVALMAFLPGLTGPGTAALRSAAVQAITLFLPGLLLAALASGIAYIYQSAVTAKTWNDLSKVADPESKIPYPYAKKITSPLIIAVIGLTLVAYVLFAVGAWTLQAALVP